jgi:hypothetical protein
MQHQRLRAVFEDNPRNMAYRCPPFICHPLNYC